MMISFTCLSGTIKVNIFVPEQLGRFEESSGDLFSRERDMNTQDDQKRMS